jgi:hypothetical protein
MSPFPGERAGQALDAQIAALNAARAAKPFCPPLQDMGRGRGPRRLRPEEEAECEAAYDADRATCVATYRNLQERIACYERAYNRYARCLGGQEPRPRLIP